MKKTNANLMLCAMVFAMALVISNVVTAKTVQTGIPLFGSTVLVPSAVICYCVTFLMTDVVGEIWGPKEARFIVAGGLVCQVLACVLILIAQALPAADASMQAAYDMLLGQNAVFVAASLTAYLCSQSWDVFVFHKIRNHFLAKESRGEGTPSPKRWIWNNASTMTSQIIDTVIFIGIAFGIGFGWLFDAAMLPQLGAMMVGQYLCKFLLAALELFDREADTYALDVISLVEATLEQPRQVLRAQEKEARSAAVAAMKADGVDYEERMERLEEVTYPKPLEDVLQAAFEKYCQAMPWALDYELAPKSVLRDMVETASDFKTYVQRYGLSRCEGILLRYLSDAYHVLDRTVPPDAFDERLDDITCWLGWLVRSIDSSLFDEWAGNEVGASLDAAAPGEEDAVVADRRAVTLLVRNALFARVRLAALGRVEELGALDADWGFTQARWAEVLEAFHAEHDEIMLNGDARSAAYLDIDESHERDGHTWHVRQIILDSDADLDFRIEADVDLDATQEEGQAVFANYHVGSIEDFL